MRLVDGVRHQAGAAVAGVAGARSRFARRRWRGRLGRWRTALLVVVAAAVAGGAGWLFWASDLLAVDEVVVEGTGVLSDDRVLRAAGVPAGTPLVRVDLAEVEDRVAALAPVDGVDVRRDWPGTVRVVVREREPVAVLTQHGDYRALDGAGVLFRRYAEPPADLPLVDADELAAATGRPDGTAADGPARREGEDDQDARVRADALREVASVVEALDPDISGRVDHVEVASLDAIVLVLRDGARVRWGSAADSALKAEVLTALMRVPSGTYDVSVPQAPTTSNAPAT